ncbi:hypothetical protein [Amycolatopsis thermoflava]|uniref:hypothetical protein n=1 Tax=Amycolatopsis thermoflava TaxID=84480 RepID=UPI0003F84BB2|nr:hypothetical protein [Amycolatopsis thermoflava]
MTSILDIPAVRARRAPVAARSALCLGDSPALPLVLDAAMSTSDDRSDPDAVLIACDDWPDGDLPGRVPESLARARLHGRTVGLIAVAADLAHAARVLAQVRLLVRRHGGLPVGAGVCVDAADIVHSARGPAFADVTVAARLALLGRRVDTMARSRRVLRAA